MFCTPFVFLLHSTCYSFAYAQIASLPCQALGMNSEPHQFLCLDHPACNKKLVNGRRTRPSAFPRTLDPPIHIYTSPRPRSLAHRASSLAMASLRLLLVLLLVALAAPGLAKHRRKSKWETSKACGSLDCPEFRLEKVLGAGGQGRIWGSWGLGRGQLASKASVCGAREEAGEGAELGGGRAAQLVLVSHTKGWLGQPTATACVLRRWRPPHTR